MGYAKGVGVSVAGIAGKLTVVGIKSLGEGKHFDGGGLYLDVKPAGRYWRMKYRFGGKEKLLALGVYPEVSLAEARRGRDEARAKLRESVDPSAQRQEIRKQAEEREGHAFRAVAAEWLDAQRGVMSDSTFNKAGWMLELVDGSLGGKLVGEIEAPDILAAIRPIEARGKNETAHRVKQRIGQIIRYAVATGRAKRDPTGDLRGALVPVVSRSRAAVTTPEEIAALLKDIHAYKGHLGTSAALRLAPLLFARPGNLRAMEWSELDLEGALWRIPANKMKMREAHVVPLAKQAVAILKELQAFTGNGKFCFPSVRSDDKPISENTINAALRRLGYEQDKMCGHGFRAMASTRLNEMGWPPDVIERQLAHAERNKVRAAYNRAQYLTERKKMMQAWADYLDSLVSS